MEPYGMAHRRGHWYIAGGTSHGDRVYRVDRLDELTIGDTADAFKRPRRFRTRDVMRTQPWESGSDETVEATVRFDESVAWWAARSLGVPIAEDGTVEVTVPVANRDAFVGWVLSFGEGAEVLAPQELRDELVTRISGAMQGLP